MMHRNIALALLGLSTAGLTACGEAPETPAGQGTAASPPAALVDGSGPVARRHDPIKVKRGGEIFQHYCAECHGQQGQGAFNWRQPGPDGKYPAPPLNGTGHTWHHPYAMLTYVIKNGSPGGTGNMPAWGGKLTDQDIAAVIEWFQSQWSDEVYAAWYRNDQRARKR